MNKTYKRASKIFYSTLIVITILIVLNYVLKINSCNEPTIIDNSDYLKQIDSLRGHNNELKIKGDSIQLAYEKAKEKKDSIVYKVRNHYIMVYDTITQDMVECLPKQYVDTLIYTYESVIFKADSVIEIKDQLIDNSERRNEIKDTLISNYQLNEKVLQKALKKEKRKKWLFGGGGFLIGYLFGKV